MKTLNTRLLFAAVAGFVAPSVAAANTLLAEHHGRLVSPVPTMEDVSFVEYVPPPSTNFVDLFVSGFTGLTPVLRVCTINKDGYAFQCWDANPGLQKPISVHTKTIRITLQSGADVDFRLRLWKVT